MGTPMEGFFDGVEIMAEAMSSASAAAAAQGAFVDASIPSPKPSLVEQSA